LFDIPVPLAPPTPVVEQTPAPTPSPAPAATDMNADTGAPAPAEVVSPQMLLKYFNKSTNGASTGIIAPLDLSAPNPQPRPSQATYSN
jgi:hypothetical protein